MKNLIAISFIILCTCIAAWVIWDILTIKKAVQEERIALEKEKLRSQLVVYRKLLWYNAFKWHILFFCALFSGLTLIVFYLTKKYNICIVRIGKHSEIPLKRKDLSTLFPIMVNLSLAEIQASTSIVDEKCLRYLLQTVDKVSSLVSWKSPHELVADKTTLALPGYVPCFTELLHSGEISPGKPIIFGYTEFNQSRKGTWIDLFSSAVGGVPGTGKTATLRNLIAQSLITGQVNTFWIIDYHYPHPQSLLASLGILKNFPAIHYAENTFETVDVLEEVNNTIEDRLQRKESSYPIKVLCIDEAPKVCQSCPKTIEIILRIATESRKCGIYGLFSAQFWKADAVGGTEIRDCLTSRFIHQMKPRQANLLLQDSEQSKMVKELSPGKALFSPVNGKSEILSIPYCAPSDMPYVFELIENTVIQTESKQQWSPRLAKKLLLGKFDSIALAAQELNINPGQLSRYFNSGSLPDEKIQQVKQAVEWNVSCD